MRAAVRAGQGKASDAWGQYVKGSAVPPAIQVPGGGLLKLAALRTASQQNLKAVQQQVTSLLDQNGIDSGGVTLQLDADGDVSVLSPDAQKSAIESLLQSRPDIQASLVSAVQDAQVLQAASSVHTTGSGAQESFSAAFASLAATTATFSLTGTSDPMTVTFVPTEQ
jgi:hypothetical protein